MMIQLRLWPKLWQNLTDGEIRLIEAIRRLQAKSSDGRARSLFQAALEADLDYPWAHNRLMRLEVLRYVGVRRLGKGVPMELWILN